MINLCRGHSIPRLQGLYWRMAPLNSCTGQAHPSPHHQLGRKVLFLMSPWTAERPFNWESCSPHVSQFAVLPFGFHNGPCSFQSSCSSMVLFLGHFHPRLQKGLRFQFNLVGKICLYMGNCQSFSFLIHVKFLVYNHVHKCLGTLWAKCLLQGEPTG